MLIRMATVDDAEACAAVYAPYVTDTPISFETEAPTTADMAGRIERAIAWFVLEERHVAGYAYASPFHPRAAYRWACEVSVYLERGRRRTGAGRALYEVLLPHLADRGYRTAIAGMTLPNPASEGLHAALGFEPVGTYRNIGFKGGAWHDVAWTQKTLATGEGLPREPV
jgi:L-amino acid N-acyltransferase YncA